MICFLKSKDFYQFDAFQVTEAILKLLEDPKEKVRMVAIEALAAYSSIGNKFSIKEIVY